MPFGHQPGTADQGGCSQWRGVVLAPDSGVTYCLLTVLPHEKVNDFAASRRFGAARASRALEASYVAVREV